MEQRPEKPLKSENDNDILVLCVVAFGPQVSSGCIRSFIFHLFSQAAHKTCSTMKNIIKGVELEEVKNVILAMQANPLVGDIIPPAWHTNFPVCGDIRHGPKARAKRKGPPRRSVQHYLNMLLLAHILSWYRPILWKGDCGPDERAITKRFKDHLLRINLTILASGFRCTINQISAALSYLEEIGAIRRVYSTTSYFGSDVKKAVFVLPVLEKVTEMSQTPEETKCLQNSSEVFSRALRAQDGRSVKRKIVPALSAISSTLQAQNGQSFKRNLSYAEPKASNATTTPKATESGVVGFKKAALAAQNTDTGSPAESIDIGGCFLMRWCQTYKQWFKTPYIQKPGEARQATIVIEELKCRPKDLLAYVFRMWINTVNNDQIQKRGFDPLFYQIKGSRNLRFFLSHIMEIAEEQNEPLDCCLRIEEPEYRQLENAMAKGRPA